MDYLELLGTALGLIYLWLEYRASAWLWIPSILMPAIYLEVYYSAGLYADFGISIYYIIASVYGLVCWMRHRKDAPGNDDADTQGITRTPARLIAPLAGAFTLIFIAIGLLLSRFTDSTVPWADSFTTTLSIVALWMLARKYIEQWIVWIAADAALSALYVYKGLYPTAGLYLLYAVVAVMGYRKWKTLLKHEHHH